MPTNPHVNSIYMRKIHMSQTTLQILCFEQPLNMELVAQASVLVTLLTFLVSSSAATSPTNAISFRVDLTHVDAGGSYTLSELLKRAAKRSKSRATWLANGFGPVSVHPSQGEYVLDLAIGTPPLAFTGILDTGSDLIWTQCKTCMRCIPQPSPLFDPFSSASFSTLPCNHKLCRAMAKDEDSACAPNCLYHYHYGDNTDSIGYMGMETFTFGTTKRVRIPHISFGCGLYNDGDIQNSSGVIGFGRGPISLISQLGVGAFSYCFTDNFKDDTTRSPLFFGSLASLTGPNVQSTPLIQLSPSLGPVSSFYYLSLKGITVGNTMLPIPQEAFQVKEDGSGGVIIDSGTAFLMLDSPAYKPFVEAFRSQIKLHPANVTDPQFELCYKIKRPHKQTGIPKLVFHFDGADWKMPQRNYMLMEEEGLLCLVVQESPGLSILGNVQTQNMHVLYDLKKNRLSFAPSKCDQL